MTTNPPTVAGVSEPTPVPERPTLYGVLQPDARAVLWLATTPRDLTGFPAGTIQVTIPASTSPPPLPQPAPEPKVEPAREGREWEKSCKVYRGTGDFYTTFNVDSPSGAYWLGREDEAKWYLHDKPHYREIGTFSNEAGARAALSRAPTPPDAQGHVPDAPSPPKPEAEKVKPKRMCPNCDEPGPHFAPPSMGESGFYICKPKPEAESKAPSGGCQCADRTCPTCDPPNPAAQPQSDVGDDWLPEGIQADWTGEPGTRSFLLNRIWRAEVRRLRTQLAEMTRRAEAARQIVKDLENACSDLRNGPQF